MGGAWRWRGGGSGGELPPAHSLRASAFSRFRKLPDFRKRRGALRLKFGERRRDTPVVEVFLHPPQPRSASGGSRFLWLPVTPHVCRWQIRRSGSFVISSSHDRSADEERFEEHVFS
ncbi:uncharacterized protein RHO17_014100 [Thomomys bottae]